MSLTDPGILLAMAAASLACYFFLFPRRSVSKLPPCPATRLPVLGTLLSLENNPRDQFKAWHKQYGNYISLYFGQHLVIMINGYKAIREAIVTKGMAFNDRPKLFVVTCTGLDGKGVAAANGETWKELRQTTIQILRDFGMGKDALAEKTEEEISFYLEELLKLRGQATEISALTYVSIGNCLCSILFGKRFDYDDTRFKRALECNAKVLQLADGASIINFFPWLEYLPGDFFKAETIRSENAIIKKFLLEEIAKVDALGQVDELEGNDEEDCFIFQYRRKCKENNKAGKMTSLDTDNLVKTMIDLFMVGTETSECTIDWCLVYAMNYPEVQKKIHLELDKEVGRERRPSHSDKYKLPYLEAVIMETQRLSSMTPLSGMRKTTAEVTVGSENYVIPKGTQVITNLDTVLHDPDIWGADVLEFRPERFLNEDGSLRRREELIPFSIGKRSCLGEAMAKMTLFLYLSAIFQRFEVHPEQPDKPPSMELTFGVSAKALPHKAIFIDRLPKLFE